MTTDDIRDTQKLLKGLSYYDGAIDGLFGPKSRSAMQSALQSFVRDWQTTVNPSHVAPLSAFLDMIAYAEGTLKFGDENGYNVIVGGATFNDYSDHPRVLVNLPNLGIKSTAAGRYQILSRFWDAYKKQMNLPDFGSDSQDRYAIQQIHEQGAYYDVIKGDFGTAIRKCSNIWASLPGAGYGQREVDRDQLIVYAKARLLTYQADELA